MSITKCFQVNVYLINIASYQVAQAYTLDNSKMVFPIICN